MKCNHIEVESNAALIGKLEVSEHLQIESVLDEDPVHGEDQTEGSNEDDEEMKSVADDPPEKKKTVHLLIVEPQVDFYPGGSLGNG